MRSHPPPPPPLPEERRLFGLAARAYFRLHWPYAPRGTPPGLAAEPHRIPRAGGGALAALHFPHPRPQGVVLLGHPSSPEAKSWWSRAGRIPFLHDLGLAAVAFDYGGYGESDRPTRSYAAEWADVLAWARDRFDGLPLHAWGASIGGYFLHHALAADADGLEAVVFEDVHPNLLQYGWLGRPRWKPWDTVARRLAPSAAAWWPAVAHAPAVRAGRVLYLQSGRDAGIPQDAARALAEAAGPRAHRLVVEGAGHLGAWTTDRPAVARRIARHLQHVGPRFAGPLS